MLLTSFDPFRGVHRGARRTFGSGRWTACVGHRMDVIRGKDDIELRFDLPGMDPESIDVTVDRGVLTVKAQRHEYDREDEKLFIRERVIGSYTRRLSLPTRSTPTRSRPLH